MSQRFETFSYLPPLSRDEMLSQIEWMVSHKLTPVIEYLENPERRDRFWHLWPLTDTVGTTPAQLLGQIDQCQRNYPLCHVRLSGYDKTAGYSRLSFIVAGAK